MKFFNSTSHTGILVSCLALIVLLAINGCGGGDGEGNKAEVIGMSELATPDHDVMAQIQAKLPMAYQTAMAAPEQSATLFREIVLLAPEYPMPYYHYAFGLALQGKTEAALDTLQIAIDKGLCDPGIIERASQFAEVIAHPDWAAMNEKMLEVQVQYRQPDMASYQELDPNDARDFASLDTLRTVFLEEIRAASSLVMLHTESKVRLHLWNILNLKLAALEKLKTTETDEAKRMQIDREICMVTCSFEESRRTPWLASTVSVIEQKTEAFMLTYTDKASECAEAGYMQARARWYQTQPPDRSDLTSADLDRAVEIFSSVDERFPGQAGSFLALMDVITIITDKEGYSSPLLPAIIEKIDGTYSRMFNQQQFQRLKYSYSPIRLAVKGMPEFSVTDLEGKEWLSTKLDNKLILIDFWATWCNPCVREIPGLVELYKKYHDKGFEVLGISLDQSNKLTTNALKAYMKDNNMTWPMVYDGMGWATPSVAACNVGSIPFPILIDEDGKIIAAAGDATGAKLHEKVAEILGE